MPYVHPDVLDKGLEHLQSATNAVYACSASPTTYAEASLDFAIATHSSPILTGPEDRADGGREVTLETFTGGLILASGTVTAIALVDTTNSHLLAAQETLEDVDLEIGGAFTLEEPMVISAPSYGG